MIYFINVVYNAGGKIKHWRTGEEHDKIDYVVVGTHPDLGWLMYSILILFPHFVNSHRKGPPHCTLAPRCEVNEKNTVEMDVLFIFMEKYKYHVIW